MKEAIDLYFLKNFFLSQIIIEMIEKKSTSNVNSPSGNESYKTLLIIRHAKSSWENGVLTDFDRTLNERGLNDALAMAKRLQKKNIAIDLLVSSPAKRAKKTAELFASVYEIKTDQIKFIPALYHAPSNTFFEVISTIDDAANTVAIFSHNPGITEFVNLLTENVQLDNMPTCGIFAVKIYSTNWGNFVQAKKEFLFFDYPKNI